jgi:ATP-dependent RNA helicase DBP3
MARIRASAGKDARVLVFVLYKAEAPRVEACLRRAGHAAHALEGGMAQGAREAALTGFRDGSCATLVATDVAARGLDIPGVAAVINYSFPLTVEDYVHRIGRTGRGGADGAAVTFFTGEAHEKALAGELARVLMDGGFEDQCAELKARFPMTIRKKEHAVYGAFFRKECVLSFFCCWS